MALTEAFGGEEIHLLLFNILCIIIIILHFAAFGSKRLT